ncbi:MAG: sugar transferase [Anaerolineaceae bacterium]
MNSQYSFSVIIPAKNSAKSLPACLQSLLHQDGFQFGENYEVVVVDDGSSDETAFIGEQFGVRVIRQANSGPAAARNCGAKAAQSELLLFTDSDCIPQSNWCLEMSKPFKDPEVMGVKGAYLCQEHNQVARFVQQEFEYKYMGMAKLPQIDFIDTYSAAYRKFIFLENNGFDENFPIPSVEDQELSFRISRKGYKLVFQPTARVYHSHDADFSEYARRKWGIGYWKAFMLRWLPEKALSDTYTPASQRWQIVILAVFLLSLIFGLFWHWLWILASFSLVLFYLSAVPFIKLLLKNDNKIIAVSLVLLIVRAGALGFGLLYGFLFPPKTVTPYEQGPGILESVAKRLMDILGSIIGIILSAPFVGIAAAFIAIDSKGSVFYTQMRAGKNGKPFRLYKLRTMVVTADQMVEEQLKQNSLINENSTHKNANDPRVTRVGRFLRRWSLDEIPQFWNILKGEMSLVGPRPEETRVVAKYTDHQRQRLVVKPGLTGPMQISGRADLGFDDRLACELDYIKDYSLWEDVKILLKSIKVVLSGKGAY